MRRYDVLDVRVGLLSGHHGAEVAHRGDDFAITGWAPFTETAAG